MNLEELRAQIDEKISKKNQKYLIYLASFLLIIIGYFLICSPLKTKNDELRVTVDTLTQQRAEYREMDAHKAENKKATAKMKKELGEILGRYPETVFEEDIVQAMTNIENNSDISVSDITCETTNLVTSEADYSTDQSTADASGADSAAVSDTGATASNNYRLYVKSSTVTFTVGYEGIKAVAAFVKNGALKKNIESISLAYDNESGALTGTMIINFYSINGEDIDNDVHEELDEVNKGTTNIFKTVR